MSVVFTAAMSHAPHITAFPDRGEAGAGERIHAAMREAGDRLRAQQPDVVVVIASDHFTNLFIDRMPAFCVGTADSYEGPVENWIRLPRRRYAGDQAMAEEILRCAFSAGFDPAFAERLAIEHGIAVPLSFLLPDDDTPIVPVLQNCMVPPMPTLQRCHAFGRAIRAAADASGLRVAVIGTGGLSHSPGAPEAGRIDADFDRSFLATLASDDPARVLETPIAAIDAAGFGTWEIRQWVAALGAAENMPATVLAYEPIEAWETGCGVAVFDHPATQS